MRGWFHDHKIEVVIFFVALGIRLLFFVAALFLSDLLSFSFPSIGSDSQDYLRLSQTLRQSGRFIDEFNTPVSLETPGYPLFLLFIQYIFQSIWAIPLVQVLLTGFSAVLIYRIGNRISHFVGFGSSVLFCFDPLGIYYSNVILTESLFVFLAVSGVYLVIRSIEVAGWSVKYAIVGGVVIGSAMMVRPIGEVFIPAILFYFSIMGFITKIRFKKIIIIVCLFLFGVLIIVGPWFVRNRILSGRWELSSAAAWQFAFVHSPAFYAYKHSVSEDTAREIFRNRLLEIAPTEYKEYISRGSFGHLFLVPYLWQVALDQIKEYPMQYTLFYIKRTAPFFLSDGLRDTAVRIGLIRPHSLNISDHILRGDWGELAWSFISTPLNSALFLVGFGFWLFIFFFMCIGILSAIRFLYQETSFLI